MSKEVINKVKTSFQRSLNKRLRDEFEEYIDELKGIYLDTYDRELLGVVTDRLSLSNPNNFYEDYEGALDVFDYFYDETDDYSDGFNIKIPTEDTFNFEGRLKFIQLLISGIAGKYYELPQEDYYILKKSKGIDDKVKRVIYDLPEFFDDSTPRELRFYLVPSRGNLYKSIQGILGKKLVTFPFSNNPPIDLFEDGEKAFKDKFSKIIIKVIESSIKDVKRH